MDDKLTPDYPDQIKGLRAKLGLTQIALAECLGGLFPDRQSMADREVASVAQEPDRHRNHYGDGRDGWGAHLAATSDRSGGGVVKHTPSMEPRHAVPDLPCRKNIRLQGWDYSSPGWYFLTICTQNMRSVFGTVVNGHMVLNAAGSIAEQCWREIPAHFPRAVVDEFVVMPNHVHGLLQLVGATACHGRTEAFGKPVAGSIPTILRSYKSAVTRALGEKVWQSRFHDMRARDDAARENIRTYIRHNPENFAAVMQGAEVQNLGNRALLDLPKVGFLASRGETNPHGRLPIKPGEAVISGFLSPMERVVFKACLEHRLPTIWVQPRGLDVRVATACRGPAEDALAKGRLLLVTPFDSAVETPNARRAVWCNQYVIEHCHRLIVGHLNPDGMLACLLSEANPEKEIHYL